jgi:hypothetical protein
VEERERGGRDREGKTEVKEGRLEGKNLRLRIKGAFSSS